MSLFEFVWAKDNVGVRNLTSLNFQVFEGKKFKFLGPLWTSLYKIGNISESINLMKDVY